MLDPITPPPTTTTAADSPIVGLPLICLREIGSPISLLAIRGVSGGLPGPPGARRATAAPHGSRRDAASDPRADARPRWAREARRSGHRPPRADTTRPGAARRSPGVEPPLPAPRG